MVFTSLDVHHDACGWNDNVDYGMSNRPFRNSYLPLNQNESYCNSIENVLAPQVHFHANQIFI